MSTIDIDGTTYSLYHKTGTQPMRPYVPGEDLTGVTMPETVQPAAGGMIACNPQNPKDCWYVPPDYFQKNYVPA